MWFKLAAGGPTRWFVWPTSSFPGMTKLRAAVYLSLGSLYLIEKDNRCVKYLLKACLLGSKVALGLYGFMLEFGIILKKDLKSAERVYMKSLPNLQSCLRLAFLKAHGRAGIVMDMPSAKKYQKMISNNQMALNWLNFAADKGLAEAQLCLALALHNGTIGKKSPESAFKWCEKAALQGLSTAENLLGNMYCEGSAVEANYSFAMEWYYKSASKMEATAIYNIGTMFERGYGVEQSFERAIEWYTRACRFGSTNAHNVLGTLIEDGLLIPSEPEDAVQHYLIAAADGDAHAQYNLGRCYHDGFGSMKNNAVALRWFERSAKQGLHLGLMSVAICYEHGIGTEPDMDKAIAYYTEAALDGVEHAKTRLFSSVTSRILKVGSIFLKTSTSKSGLNRLPVELRHSILTHLNIANVASNSDIYKLFDGSLSKKDLDILLEEKQYKNAHKRNCSCSTESCQRIMHVMASLSQL